MLRDFKCDQCGHVKTDEWTTSGLAWPCRHCEHGLMMVLPSAPSFVVKGYAASNGYSKDRS